MTAPNDVAALVERLKAKRIATPVPGVVFGVRIEPDPLCWEAASALEASEAKIAALTAAHVRAKESEAFWNETALIECRARLAAEERVVALTAENATLREGLRSAIRQIEALCSPLDVPDDARAALRQEGRP